MASLIRTHLLLHTLPGLESHGGWGVAAWQPRVDVYEMNEVIVILVEAPGLQTDDLKLHFEPGALVVEGFRVRPQLPATARTALTEMNYGAFRRQFALPADANGDEISAAYDVGILQITVPRHAKAAPQMIRVEVR